LIGDARLDLFFLSMIFSENPFQLFRITL